MLLLPLLLHRPPFHTAVYWGQKAVIETLVAKGADINAKEKDGTTPLHEAVGKKHTEIVKFLLDKGAEINTKGGWQRQTPLHCAVRVGDSNTVELLLAHGADINAKDRFGDTPLLKAVSSVKRAPGPEKHPSSHTQTKPPSAR